MKVKFNFWIEAEQKEKLKKVAKEKGYESAAHLLRRLVLIELDPSFSKRRCNKPGCKA